MTKKYIFISLTVIFIIALFNLNSNKKIIDVFNETSNDYDFSNYELEFIECDLNTDNFISIFSYFNNKDYKILEISLYINESYKNIFKNKKFLFYSNDLNLILDNFKNEYIDIMLNNDIYVNNICIQKVKINTAKIFLNEFKEIINIKY